MQREAEILWSSGVSGAWQMSTAFSSALTRGDQHISISPTRVETASLSLLAHFLRPYYSNTIGDAHTKDTRHGGCDFLSAPRGFQVQDLGSHDPRKIRVSTTGVRRRAIQMKCCSSGTKEFLLLLITSLIFWRDPRTHHESKNYTLACRACHAPIHIQVSCSTC
jgi:hypothetical protein